jgi:biotin transport system substrate-specific component
MSVTTASTHSSHASHTLIPHVLPRRGVLANPRVANAALVVGGALFVALCAQIRIPLPFTPIPFTGQTLGVLLAGSLLGTQLGLLSLILYLAMGLGGLPFFAGGNAGIEILYGGTVGYLVGFPFAAALVGYLSERGWDRRFGTMAFSMVLGNVVIYLFGVAWLSLSLGLPTAILTGVVPFILGDIIKMVIAGVALPSGWRLLGKR